MSAHVRHVTIDCRDPYTLSRFWAEALGFTDDPQNPDLPDDPEAHFVLGMCYEKGGMDKAAVREYSRAIELKPNHSEAKKRLKKMKWGF